MPEGDRISSVIPDSGLPFEKDLLDLEQRIQQAASDEERDALVEQLNADRARVYASLTPWQRVLLARHPNRPRMMDYVNRVFEDFVELHGDRALGDDSAMIAGIARFKGRSVAVVGQQKGVSTDEKVYRNFGMAHPEGYRKAMRIFRLAERLSLPIVTFVDTPAAHPGVEAEEHGQGPLIARSLMEMLEIDAPILAVVLGEGGSGGALGIAVADRVAMFEYAVYMICPPERCAEILWRDVERKELAATALKVTANDLYALGTVDVVLSEPGGGAHRMPLEAACVLSEELETFLARVDAGAFSVSQRQVRFRNMGVWRELPPDE